MNKKIKELAVESGFATGYDRTQTGRWILSDKELEKFAELLFNEIANTAVISDGMFTGNERRLSVELQLGDMVKKISVFVVEE